MKTTFVIVFILGIIGMGVYFLLQDDNSFRVSFLGQGVEDSLFSGTVTSSQKNSSSSQGIVETMRSLGGSTLSAIQNAGSWIVEQGNELFTSATQGIHSIVSDTAKDTAQKAFTSVGNSLGISSSTSSEDVILSLSYVIHKDTETSFVLRDASYKKNQEIASYRIDWGDGVIDIQDDIVIQNMSIFSHAWRDTGEYTVAFHIIRGDKESIYTTDVTVK
ncbi:MAG: hypothetical protein WC099_03570 [Candidatus Paceibacterota bacterium]